MESDKLYRVQREDLPKLEQLLYACFKHDPLYETLIPDPEVRERLMPELLIAPFSCLTVMILSRSIGARFFPTVPI